MVFGPAYRPNKLQRVAPPSYMDDGGGARRNDGMENEGYRLGNAEKPGQREDARDTVS